MIGDNNITNPLKSGCFKFVVCRNQKEYEETRLKHPEIDTMGIFFDDESDGSVFALYGITHALIRAKDVEPDSIQSIPLSQNTDVAPQGFGFFERLKKRIAEENGTSPVTTSDVASVTDSNTSSIRQVQTSMYPLGRKDPTKINATIINPVTVQAAFWNLYDAPFYNIESACDVVDLTLDNNRTQFPTAIKFMATFPLENLPFEEAIKRTTTKFSIFGKRLVLNHPEAISPREWPIYVATSPEVDFLQINFDQNKYIDNLQKAIKMGTSYPDAMIRPFVCLKNFMNPPDINRSRCKIVGNPNIHLMVSNVQVDLDSFEGYSVSGIIKDCVIFVSPAMHKDGSSTVNLKNVKFENCVFVDYRDYIRHEELSYEEYIQKYNDLHKIQHVDYTAGKTLKKEGLGRMVTCDEYPRSGKVIAPFHNCTGSFALDHCFCASGGKVFEYGVVDLDLTMRDVKQDFKDCSIEGTDCIFQVNSKINYSSIVSSLLSNQLRSRPVIRLVQDNKTFAQLDFRYGKISLADEKILEIRDDEPLDEKVIHQYQDLASIAKKELIGLLETCLTLAYRPTDKAMCEKMLHEVEAWDEALTSRVKPVPMKYTIAQTHSCYSDRSPMYSYMTSAIDGQEYEMETFRDFHRPERLSKLEYNQRDRRTQKYMYTDKKAAEVIESGRYRSFETDVVYKKFDHEFDKLADQILGTETRTEPKTPPVREKTPDEIEMEEIINAFRNGVTDQPEIIF